MYYFLEQNYESEIYCRLGSRKPKHSVKVPWINGQLLPKPPSTPLIFDLNEDSGVMMPDYFAADVPLFSRALYSSLEQYGVDNIIPYGVDIINPVTHEITSSYIAGNIVGLVKGGGSEIPLEDDEGNPTNFSSDPRELKINPRNCLGLLCFRLREDLSSIVLHEIIVDKLVPKGYRGLSFRPAEIFS